MRKTMNCFYGLSIMAMASMILSSACSHGSGPAVDQIDLEGVKNHLLANTDDKYLEFTFDQSVASAGETSWTLDWSVTVSGNKVKASYKKQEALVAGDDLDFALTVSPSGKGDTRSFAGTYKVAGTAFNRAGLSASADESGGSPQYEIRYYDHASATVGLAKNSASPSPLVSAAVNGAEEIIWVALDREEGDDAKMIDIFNAVWTPNSVGSRAVVESGKSAVTYTEDISDAVHALFNVAISGDGSGDKIEIKGAALPGNNNGAYDPDNLIVIQIGLPDGDNSDLPTFYIPSQGLGSLEEDDAGDYSHIRLRVNSGASLVLLANNSAYISSNAGNPCDTGLFKGGCVEVMAGGQLRDGAFEGFPLGSDAVILNRYGSYLSVGPEPDSADATSTTGTSKAAYDLYYSGYLVGPPATGENAPRIEWDATGNTTNTYLEVRPGQIATDAQLTAKKSVGLIYSVWFVGDAHLTVDAASETAVVFGSGQNVMHGIMANETNSQSFDFYGCDTSRTGENKPFITIKQGNLIDGRFLISNVSTEAVTPILASSGDVKIGFKSAPSGNAVEYGTDTGIAGYLLEDLSSDDS